MNAELELKDCLALDRSRLASGRTLMARVRSAISMVTFCFTVYEFLRFLQDQIDVPVIRPPDRPHQALAMRYPAERYARSARPYRGLEDLDYPFHDHAHIVAGCGRVCFDSRKINLGAVFAGQKVGVKQVADQVWLVSFMHYDLGFFDNESCRVECTDNPFGAKVLPMSPE